MWVNTSGGGLAFAFADVLLTPAGPALVPIPYANTADPALGVPPVSNVIINGAPAHNMGTVIPTSNGANAGVAGVVSGTVGSASTPTSGAQTVLFGGAPVTRLSDTTSQNGGNASGSYVAPSQTKVLVLAR
ncbi:MAG: DUF4150 domain-containing protein [Minicystis sp.]